ncbi:MAG: hypothetical protein ABJK20_15280 [Halieaceae bacterium]
MTQKMVFAIAALALAGTLIYALYWLTLDTTDPCANPQADVSAAILADESGDQAGLANRAILMRGNCVEQENNGQ